MEYFDVYNKYGEKTGKVIGRGEAHKEGICHRVVHLWILNKQNEILIQQRSANKESAANFWYVSVGGHIETAETIENTLIRETKEELGLDITPLTDSIEYLFTFKEVVKENSGSFFDNEFCDVFALKADFDINQVIMQTDEVQAVKYISYEGLRKIVIDRDPSFWQHEIGYKMLLASLDVLCNSQ